MTVDKAYCVDLVDRRRVFLLHYYAHTHPRILDVSTEVIMGKLFGSQYLFHSTAFSELANSSTRLIDFD